MGLRRRARVAASAGPDRPNASREQGTWVYSAREPAREV